MHEIISLYGPKGVITVRNTIGYSESQVLLHTLSSLGTGLDVMVMVTRVWLSYGYSFMNREKMRWKETEEERFICKSASCISVTIGLFYSNANILLNVGTAMG